MFMSRIRYGLLTALAAGLVAPLAHSHVTLQAREAPVDSSFRAVFSVMHGCNGSPTTKIRIRIPEGVVGVRPQPKAGWTLELVKGDYEKPHMRHGSQISSGVRELVWQGGPLADEHFDEFVFTSYLSSDLTPDSMLYFPVVQECEKGVERWIDLPSDSQMNGADDHADSPAPGLRLLPAQ